MSKTTTIMTIGCILMWSTGASADFVDQKQELETNHHQIELFEPVGQGFTPSYGEHTGVELLLTVQQGWDPTPLTIRIREGGITGPVIGQTTLIPEEGWFFFPIEFTATPGELYVIEADAPDSTWVIADGQNNPYAGGMAYLFGEPVPYFDLCFRTWVSDVPAPGALLLLGLAGLVRGRRR